MSACCSFVDLVPTVTAVITGDVSGPNRCPCSDTPCEVILKPKPNYEGWAGTLKSQTGFDTSPDGVSFAIDISCVPPGFKLSVSSNTSSGCGGFSALPIVGTCFGVAGSNAWGPVSCACCNCVPGHSVNTKISLKSSNVLLPPWGICLYCCAASGLKVCTKPTGVVTTSSPSEVSAAPVRYSTGEIAISATDIQGSGFGSSFGHTRRFSSRLTYSSDQGNGFNWLIDERPFLSRGTPAGQSGTYVCVNVGAGYPLWFKEQSGVYSATFGNKQTLVKDAAAGVFVFTAQDGTVLEFEINTGQFMSQTSPGGQTVVVTALTPDQTQVATIEQYYMDGSDVITEQFQYDYTQPFDQQLATLTRRTSVNGGDWTNVERAVYTYYGLPLAPGSSSSSSSNAGQNVTFGASGDLESATTQVWQDGGWVSTGTTYYRYWITQSAPTSSSSSGGGTVSSAALHLLKFLLQPGSFDRMVAASFDPFSATDDELLQFSDYYFEYDTQRRVTKEIVKSGSQTFAFAYATSSFSSNPDYWQTKTTETLPDGNQNIVYANGNGSVMLKVFKSGSDEWIEFWKYDANCKVVLHANPSAVTGYDESYGDLLNLNTSTHKYQYLRDSAGLIEASTFHAPSGYMASASLQEGQTGTLILQRSFEYCCCGPDCVCRGSSSSSSSSSSAGGNCASGIWMLARATAYPSDTDPSQTIVTSHCYSFYPGTCEVQQHITTLPVISTAQNGSGVANSNREYFDAYGNLTWKMDERGFLTRMAYDIPTGAMTQLVQDADTSLYPDAPVGWTTPSGGGLNLVTDLEHDTQGRTIQSLGPSHTIDLEGTATVIRTASWTVYDDENHVTYSGQGFATGTSPSYAYTLVNPVSITKMDANGRVNEQIQSAAATTEGSLAEIITTAGTGAAAFPQSSYTRWTTNQYTDCCLAASQRVYKLIPASGIGSSGTNYDETDYGYDVMKRRNRTVSPGGTITDLVFEPRGLVVGSYVGTNDDGATEDDPTGGGVDPDNNMVIVTGNEYDDGLDGGDGNLTEVTQHVDSSTTRVTALTYDFRNRGITIDGEIDYFQKVYYDNLSRTTKTERYDTTAAGNLIMRSETKFDDLSRVYQSIRYAVDPSNGAVGNSLTDNTWFDAAGNSIKSLLSGSNLFTKNAVDSLGRTMIRYSGYDLTETSYADAQTVTNDVILEQSETAYDAASNVIQMTSRQRYHNAPDTQKGALQNPATTPKARVIYGAVWQDGVGRTTAGANYGTNGGTTLSRPTTVPADSDSVLVTRTTFDSAGNTLDITDPAGMVTRFGYDTVGRKILQIDNYQVSSSSSSSSSSTGAGCAPSDDINRTTAFTFTADGQQATLTAVNARTGDQTTTWTYGTTLSNSDIATTQLLRSTTYPDSIGGSDVVSYGYNRQGQKRGMTDQRGCVHVYEFDKLGRQTHDRVTTAGSGVDTAVLRLSTGYEVRGMATKLTSWDNASISSGSAVNECQFVYNTFGQLITDYQEHDGAVDTSTSSKVQYGYANGSSNTIRPSTLIYPNGRVLTYGYGTTNGIDDAISRITSLIDNDMSATHLADYLFVGTGAYAVVDYGQPDVKFSLVDLSGTNDPDTGDIYSGWDRYGRLKDCRWYNYGNSTDTARLKYGYDRDSDRLWRADPVAQSLSKNFDELYTNDGLRRLKNMQRGLLNGSNTGVTSETFAQCWSLDPTSNWYGFQEAATGGLSTLVQSRTANQVNEINGITNSVGSAWVAPTYDPAGNTTTIPQSADPTKSYTATYDAWNRLVKLVDTRLTDTVQQNAYDARTFRVKRQSYTDGTPSEMRHFYYSIGWRDIEERLGMSPGSAAADRQFVWGLRYIDDVVCRDRSVAGDLDERFYDCQDGNWNSAAIVTIDGTVGERFQYDPYGTSTPLSPSFVVRSTSSFEWETTFAGYRMDLATRLLAARSRFYLTILGGWLTRDPLRYARSSISLYEYTYSNPLTMVDPLGLEGWIPYPKTGGGLIVPTTGKVLPGEPPTPNWGQGRGTFHKTENEIRFRVHMVKDCKALETDIYNSLKQFSEFNRGANNVAEVTTSDAGNRAYFDALGFMGWGSDWINADQSPVDLYFDRGESTVWATTLSGHMLEGQRFWGVVAQRGPNCDCDVVVLTWAFERKVGLVNDVGAGIAGTDAQLAVWDQYLINIRDAYNGISEDGKSKPMPIHWDWDTGSENPPGWRR